MPKIKSDQFGLFVAGGGYKSRPMKGTLFQEGQVVKTHHCGGTVHIGVGKSPDCKRGEYLETWASTGISTNEEIKPEKEEQKIAWYKLYIECDPAFHGMVITKKDRDLAWKLNHC